MKMKDTISTIERLLTIPQIYADRYNDFREGLYDVKAACEKQETKAVKDIKTLRDEDAYLYNSGICPSCGNCINDKNEDILYCYKCGQRLNWGKES